MDLASAFRLRRLLTALAIASLGLVGAVGAVGLAGEDGSVLAGPLPPSFVLAEPRVGDRGTYVWDSVLLGGDSNVTVLESHELWGFEWREPGKVRAFDERLHDVNRLYEWGWQTDEEAPGGWEQHGAPVYSVDRATRRVLAYSYVDDGSDDGSYGVQHMIAGPEQSFAINCGTASALHGRPMPLDGAISQDDLFGVYCGWHMSTSSWWADFHAVGTQDLGGIPSVLFSQKGDHPSHAWYQEGVPYPVRVALADFRDEGRYDVFRLDSFARGSGEPITWGASPLGDPAPPLRFAPPRDGGMDDTGIEHPFPLRDAVAAARADPVGAAFTRILDDGGYLAFVDFVDQVVYANGEDRIRWSLQATDGQRVEAVTVHRVVDASPAGRLPVPVPGQVLEGTPLAPTTTIEVTREDPRAPGPFPTADKLGASWPTVASLWERWRAYASDEYSGRQPNAYGHRIGCADEACEQAFLWLEGGLALSQSWANGTAGVGGVGSDERVELESIFTEEIDPRRGPSRGLDERTYRWSDSEPAPEHGTPVPTAAQMTVHGGAAWVMPSKRVVAGTGIAAAFAGLAYLLWPLAKSGAVSLFSRVEEPAELARHPMRARILGLVGAEPGIHVRELARRIGLTRTPADHHLRKLEAAGLVRQVVGPGYTCVFLRGSVDARVMDTAGLLKSDVARRMLALALARPGLGPRQAAAEMGLSPGTVAYHLKRLREAGLLVAGQGLMATDLGRQAATATTA